ncbi:MAG: hypothetical protein LBC71_04025 [Oscillospiraceae bacterium]|nr:hypothetical protein [Oscillospiraceae bacterium]
MIVIAAIMSIFTILAVTVTIVDNNESIASVIFLNSSVGEWVTPFLSIIPLFVLLSIMSDAFILDLKISEIYVIPRMFSVCKWYVCRQILLLVQVFIYVMFYVIFIYVYSFILNMSIRTNVQDFMLFLFLFLLFSYSATITVITLSLLITAKWATVLYYSYLALGIVIAGKSFNSFFRIINPANNLFYHWNSLTLWQIIMYNLLLLIPMIISGYFILNKKQIRGT